MGVCLCVPYENNLPNFFLLVEYMYFWNFLTNVEELVCASAFRFLGEKRTTSARLYISYCYLWRTLANQQINSLYVIRYSSYLATQICLHFIKLWNTIIHKANYAARTWEVIVMWVMHADEKLCFVVANRFLFCFWGFPKRTIFTPFLVHLIL